MPSLGDLPDLEIKPASSALAGGFFTTDSPGKPSFRLLAFNVATRKAEFGFASPCFCHCCLLLNTFEITLTS